METEFQDYWMHNDRRIDDWSEALVLIEEGKALAVVSAEQQKVEHERKAAAEAAFQEAQVRWHKRLMTLAHERTPEGRREAAVRFAQEHPGGYVSGQSFGIEELDRYGVDATKL